MKAVALKIVTFCFCTLAIFSCAKEEDNTDSLLIGKWLLIEKTVNNIPITLNDCEKQSNIEFQEKNHCIIYDVCTDETINSGWNFKNDMLNISEYLPAAFYIDHLDMTSLKISRKDISDEGNLKETILAYSKGLK